MLLFFFIYFICALSVCYVSEFVYVYVALVFVFICRDSQVMFNVLFMFAMVVVCVFLC